MAKFTITTRGRRKADGSCRLYIRLAHHQQVAYINTKFTISADDVQILYDKNGREVEIINNIRAIGRCNQMISKYNDRLFDLDIESMTAQQIIDELRGEQKEISFTHYVISLTADKSKLGKDNSAANYRCMYSSLARFMGKENTNINFSELRRALIDRWIESLKNTKRAANMYPTLLKACFAAAIRKFNDPEHNIIKIKYNPFDNILIPAYRTRRHIALPPPLIRQIITAKPLGQRAALAADVARLIFCLAGINCADLYDLNHDDLNRSTWQLSYNRKKTRDKSLSEAHMEITVPAIIRPLFDKYRGDDKLLRFSQLYVHPNDFVRNINKGLRQICTQLNIEPISSYTFRHSWATIARNNCNASMDDVAFALCHASAHSVTAAYLLPDYNRVDTLNEKVIQLVLNQYV
jgi:integrase